MIIIKPPIFPMTAPPDTLPKKQIPSSLIALPAQLAYLVLFSYSFLFNGVTGLTITLGAIMTLGLLMSTTAKIDWAEIFASRKKDVTPPPSPLAPSVPLPQE